MLVMYLVASALLLLLLIGALADIISSDRSRIKHLDKVAWIIIVILLPLAGSILWFTVGRDYGDRVDHGSFGDPRRWQKPEPAALDTAAELAALEAEIAASEKEAHIRDLEAQIRARRRNENPEREDGVTGR
jgi:hypothetical protein